MKEQTEMANEINDKKLRRVLPSLLTPPHLNMWDSAVMRERKDYHIAKFQKNNPSLEQEKYMKAKLALAEYNKATEENWRGNGKKRNNNNFF